MNKSTVLQDYNGNNIYPIIPYQNVFGLTSVADKFKIFYGSGRPSTVISDYNNIMVNDVYIDTNAQNRVGCFHRVMNMSAQNNTVYWQCFGNYVIETIDPPTNYENYNWYYYPYPITGVLWLNTTNNKLFEFVSWSGVELIWKDLTDTYTKSEVDALFDELQFKINKKAKPVVETVTGSPIILEDSTNRDIKELALYGKSEQVKTNGYQLATWMVEGNTHSHGGITFTYLGKGRIKVEGTNTASYNVSLALLDDTGGIIPRGQYIYQAKGVSADCIVGVYNGGTLSQDGTRVVNATTEGQAYTFYIRVQQGATVNTIVETQFESGTVAHDCEDYTGGQPSPSIGYPQQIMDVTSSTVNVFKRNIVPLNELSGKTYSKLMCEYSYDSTTNEMVLVSGEFEGTKEIYFNSYSLTDGADYTNQLNRSYVIPVAEGMQLKRVLKNNVFDSFIPTFADANKKVIKNFQGSFNQSPYIVTVPQGAKYMTIRTGVKLAQPNTEYRDNVMVCVVGTDETFEAPMIPQTASLDFTLRGIPVASGGNYTDNNNQQWLCDTIERYKDGSGKLIQRVTTITFNGESSENWIDQIDNRRIYIRRTIPNSRLNEPKTLCNCFNLANSWVGITNTDNTYYITSGIVMVSPTQNGTRLNAEQWKTFLASNNMIIYYPLTEVIETPLTAEQLAELNLSTYKPVTNIISNTDVEVTYVADTKNWIDNKCEQLQNAIISQGGNV